jgi:hypothetical protein
MRSFEKSLRLVYSFLKEKAGRGELGPGQYEAAKKALRGIERGAASGSRKLLYKSIAAICQCFLR